jgi:hypothetical protein
MNFNTVTSANWNMSILDSTLDEIKQSNLQNCWLEIALLFSYQNKSKLYSVRVQAIAPLRLDCHLHTRASAKHIWLVHRHDLRWQRAERAARCRADEVRIQVLALPHVRREEHCTIIAQVGTRPVESIVLARRFNAARVQRKVDCLKTCG